MTQSTLTFNVVCKNDEYTNNFIEHNSAEYFIEKYGKDSLSYLTLENDKLYFFGQTAKGFIAYVMIGKILVCVGNPVCEAGNELTLVAELIDACKANNTKICFSSVSEAFAESLKTIGFKISKYGEEAVLDLSLYEMKGSKTSKLRQKVKRAERCGISVIEYKPLLNRDTVLEYKINAVSEEWFLNKNGKLSFTLGELNFDNPLKRRFFVSVDEYNNVQAILSFSPYSDGRGYFLDVMRRTSTSAPGVMEKAIIDASAIMKNEGVDYLSLGLAPLAGIDINKQDVTVLEQIMNFIYNNMNKGYGFQSLYDYKKKFAPNLWETRYIAFEPDLNIFQLGYAMVKARSVDGLLKEILFGLINGSKKLIRS